MAIEDSNPERRNLVVLSMAIIAFYVGGCEIPCTGEIELPLIKLTFTDAYYLAWLVWVMLLWFAFRYWIEVKEISKLAVIKELHGTNFGLRYYTKELNEAISSQQPLSESSLIFLLMDENTVKPYDMLQLKVTSKDPMKGGNSATGNLLEASGWAKRLLVVSVACLFFKKPSLSSYYAPYLLFYIALLMGLYNKF